MVSLNSRWHNLALKIGKSLFFFIALAITISEAGLRPAFAYNTAYSQTTVTDTCTTVSCASSASTRYFRGTYMTGNGEYLDSVSVRVKKVGTLTGNVSVRVYPVQLTGDVPPTEYFDSTKYLESETQIANNIGTGDTNLNFQFLTGSRPILETGIHYIVGLYYAGLSDTNFIINRYTNLSATQPILFSDNTWSLGSTLTPYMVVYTTVGNDPISCTGGGSTDLTETNTILSTVQGHIQDLNVYGYVAMVLVFGFIWLWVIWKVLNYTVGRIFN